MNELEPRRLTPEEAPAFAKTVELCFGTVATEDDVSAVVAQDFDKDWAIGVYDSGDLVSVAGASPFELSLPAAPGRSLPSIGVAGVTCVGVLPSHRRRGLLTQMMNFQLGQFREHEVPIAVLTASESLIYGRFGYGMAASYASLEIASKRSAFRELPHLAPGPQPGAGPEPQPEPDGRLRLVGKEEATKILPGVHAEAMRKRPGDVGRSEARWSGLLDDPERDRHGGGGRMYVVHERADGSPDGYASYRHTWQQQGASHLHAAVVEDLYALTPAVHASLWRFLLDLDLVEEVRAVGRPVDEALRWMLADPRQLRTIALRDMLWAKLVDIPAALSARGYGTETELVLEVSGPGGPGAGEEGGRYRLETAPGAGDCRRARDGERSDLVLGLADLGAIYLGGCLPSTLASAGRIEEARPGALARADAAFTSALAPFCGTHF